MELIAQTHHHVNGMQIFLQLMMSVVIMMMVYSGAQNYLTVYLLLIAVQ